ncbi:MAG: ABC transporter substrate-binding protein, partial [Acidimicrobiaceae bacterium]|nr:ABC transporter substrate-binding protein [Acidimicrobiaceae bacterium]
VVPIIQQSTVDYAASPAHANAVIIDTVEQFADWWVYDAARAEFAHATMVETGLISNGPDGTVGNMDPDRVQGLIDQLVAAGMDVPSGLTAADIMTNEYIDDSIGL